MGIKYPQVDFVVQSVVENLRQWAQETDDDDDELKCLWFEVEVESLSTWLKKTNKLWAIKTQFL